MIKTLMKRNSRVYGPLLAIVVFVVAVVAMIYANRQAFSWLNPAGVIASDERNIFFFVLGLSAVVVLPVFSLLIIFALKYREQNKPTNYKPEWSENKALELTWWGIPILIIIIVGTTSAISTHLLDPYRKIASKNPTLNVQVVATEWKWLFIYPDHQVATINQLEIPINTPVHFSLSADAPMSAFWVPKLGSMIYTMNGMDSQLNLMATKLGTYDGYNTNINGAGYAKMNFKVPVVSRSDFASWLKQSAQSKNILDEHTYAKLAKPSTPTHPTIYHLADTGLYDTIVMKYMGLDGAKSTASTAKKPQQSTAINIAGTEGNK